MVNVDFHSLQRAPFKLTFCWLILLFFIGLQPATAQTRQSNNLVLTTTGLKPYHGYFYKAGAEIQSKVLNVSEQQFHSLRNQYFYGGMRIADLEIVHDGENLRISAIFEAGSGSEIYSLGQPWAEFQTLNQEREYSGLALTDVETYEQNGMRMFAGVWAPTESPDQILASPANAPTFLANFQLLTSQGYLLTDLEVFESNGRPMFMGKYDFDFGTTIVLTDMNWNEFHNKFHELNDDSYRLTDFESYVIDGAAYYSGVWQPGTQDDSLDIVDPNWDTGPIESSATLAGLTLLDFEIFVEDPDKETIHSAPVALGVTTKMGLVDHNDPTGTLMPLHNGSSSGPGN